MSAKKHGKQRLVERDHGLKALLKNVAGLSQNHRVTVGIQGPEAVAEHGSVTNAELGMIHEYGASKAGIPQRSFLRATADKGKAKYQKLLLEQAKTVAKSGVNPLQALYVVGETFRTDVIDRIRAGIAPPNTPETLARKRGETTPLIDTGYLIGAITTVTR